MVLPLSPAPCAAPSNGAAPDDATCACQAYAQAAGRSDIPASAFAQQALPWAQRAAGLDPRWQRLAADLGFLAQAPPASLSPDQPGQAAVDGSEITTICAPLMGERN